MKTIYRLALAIISAMAGLHANAQNETEAWYLETDNEVSILMDNVSYLLAADDDTTFSVVANDGSVYSGATSASFAKHPYTNSVESTASASFAVFPTVVNSTLNVMGCKQGATVSVVSMAGQTCLTETAEQGNATIDVSSLPQGHYILVVGGQSVKFIKK